jgi:hypothetical protein
MRNPPEVWNAVTRSSLKVGWSGGRPAAAGEFFRCNIVQIWKRKKRINLNTKGRLGQ